MATDKNTDKTNTLNAYEKLRSIDVSENIEKKGDFNYLSWAWAVDRVSLLDPDWSWEFTPREVFDDGTVMVHCDVKIFGRIRRSYLPVLDYSNKPVKNPNAMQINTAMQRCLVKGIALHGLGLYIYAGEDLPEVVKQEQSITEEHKKDQRDYLYAINCADNEYDVIAIEEQIKDSSLPEFMKDMLFDAAGSIKKQIENGLQRQKTTWGFINVEEAVAFGKSAKEFIESTDDKGELSGWVYDNDHKINALDKMLTAKKYNEGGSPSDRIMNLYREKMEKRKNMESTYE